ncbi:SLC13 family permease [Roseomonas sp. PWR1]|uniref:SLC13 family permease n=1 Tax=Roseomonas nitratireducens TaxID=2820810 RepID=A0ABS4AM27_9PROT|nr:SLC13 family permease [Neoroseomonas nitratireducens]MBP0462284.1 SLC13 family permease [Neoroseomonas nitratireducens]
MTNDLILVLALLGAAIAMFIANRPRMDVVGLLMIVLLPFTGVITINEALAGFADPVVVLLAALFIVGDSLVRTGAAQRVGDMLSARSGGSPTRLMILLMVAAAGLGAFMSSTAVVAIFIPIALRICRSMDVAPSQLMMPLSVAALISGMMTLVATAPNLVVSAELVRQGHQGFAFFAFTPFGVPILVLAIGYMLFARRFLPDRRPPQAGGRQAPSLAEWVERYSLEGRIYRVRVLAGSNLVGRPREELDLRPEGVNLLAIERRRSLGTAILRPAPAVELQVGDVLLIDVRAPAPRLEELRAIHGVEVLPLEGGVFSAIPSQEIGMVEVLVPPESPLIGQTVLDVRMRGEFGLTVIGLRHGSRVVGPELLEERLKAGDTLLLTGFWSDIRRLGAEDHELVVLNLPAEHAEILPAAGRAAFATGILGLFVVVIVAGWLPTVHAALIACLLLGLTRCIDLKSAYGAISWKSLVLIVGMLPFAIALQRTGGVELAADVVVAFAGEASPRVLLGLIFAITALLSLFISNTATAVLMAPVAVAVAGEIGASPQPFAMMVALAASAAFVTPVSSPVNTLVVGPGNYSFFDFVKIGLPFTIVVLLVSVAIVPFVLPP